MAYRIDSICSIDVRLEMYCGGIHNTKQQPQCQQLVKFKSILIINLQFVFYRIQRPKLFISDIYLTLYQALT